MTDVHSHILFNVDDGADTIDESIELISKMVEIGFCNIILTPHFIKHEIYCCNNVVKLDRFNTLKQKVLDKKINVNLYLGNEIFISNTIIEDIKSGNIYSLNNSKYILFEIPFNNKIVNLNDYLYELKIAGYIPVLAHPERYKYLQNNYKIVDDLKNDGILFQCNYGSIIGEYGSKAKKLLKYMLKKGYVDYFGTDVHKIKRIIVIDNFSKIKKRLIKIMGGEYFNKVMKNADNLVK